MLRNFLASITQNGTSIVGTALAIASLVLIVSLFVMHYLGFEGGPYLGILTFLILPAIFVLGLILIPIGALLYRRKLNRLHGDEHTPKLPVFDLNSPKTRGWMAVLLGATVLNIVIVAGATYKGVEVMESVEFCGQACHTVMQPEFTAYHRSPHSRVTCAECHIGPGADWFVKSKLDGAWQLVAVAFDLYPTPIPTPLENLRPARETCEQCHWPEKFVGDKLTVRRHYDTDEANTELTTALLRYFVPFSLVGVVVLIWRFFTYHLYLLVGGVVFSLFFHHRASMHRVEHVHATRHAHDTVHGAAHSQGTS